MPRLKFGRARLTFLSTLLAILACERIQVSATERESNRPADLIVTSERPVWLAALLGPVAARTVHGGRAPALLAVDAEFGENISRFVKCFDAARCLFVFPSKSSIAKFATDIPDKRRITISPVSDPLEVSVEIARKFWRTSEQVVVARINQPEGTRKSTSSADGHSREPTRLSSSLVPP